ncbi:MAG TPA: AfsR/SARP family transcriptional regulator [Actinospica sp.]|nr:AfsR/SARP family transcriptional regulator [Actinospica sp.]
MRFALLGPVQVHDDDGPVEIRGALRRTLLAALLLHRGSVLSADRLGELVWGGRPPASVTTSLYNQIMRLRQALNDDGDLIRAVTPGYLIHVAPADLDLTAFGDLCTEARRAAGVSDWCACSKLYTTALALWRGEMLADVPALHDHPSIHQFTENRLGALQGRIEADLNLGRHDELIGELRTLTVSHPLREAFHAQLMLALYRAGRQADALNVYRDLRRATRNELGVEPGAAIQTLQQRILSSDPALTPPKPNPDTGAPLSVAPPPRTTPSQLPDEKSPFTVRPTDLDELVSLVEATVNGADTGMVVISANNGAGSVGKTALAVRAAHQLREHYPDGQLFIDLHGSSSCPPPTPPEDALDYLLRSLDVPPPAIPADLDERAALYRSRLAGTRTLILLDDAANTAQVQPLLPGTPGCLVLITSRNRMMGLDDAHFFALDAMGD